MNNVFMRYIYEATKAKNIITRFISRMNVKRLNKYILGLGCIDCNVLATFLDFVHYVNENLFIKDDNLWVDIRDNNSLITFNNKDLCISITLHKIKSISNLIDSGYGYSLTLCGLYNDDKRYEFSNSYLYNMDIDKECKDVVSKMVANIVNRTIMEFFFRVYHYVE